jgi:dCMP deaminase
LIYEGLFDDASSFGERFITDEARLREIVSALATLGQKIVLTSGSFDILHEGHSRYLEAARGFGNFLIVGVDSDEKVRLRKGPHRPAVPEIERLRMVTHQRGVGLVTLKEARDPKWHLIKLVRPDILVATAETYSLDEIMELEAKYCGRVEVLERMSTVSTSARLRRIQLGNPESACGAHEDEGSRPSKQVLIYLPVLHSGFEAFLERHRDAQEILIVGKGFAEDFPVVRKDIRALDPERAAAYLKHAFPSVTVSVIEPTDLPKAVHADTLVVPDEALLRDLVAAHELAGRADIIFDPTFLYWDREWSRAQRPVDFDGSITADELSRTYMKMAEALSLRSSDWWRRVGAVVVRDEEVIDKVWNHHLPTEYTPYVDGDPRNSFRRGIQADLSTAIHAEASIMARAARHGVSLDGAELFVTTFPCPSCARLIAESGIRRCFFLGPYSVLEGDNVLRSAGVEMIWVDTGSGPSNDAALAMPPAARA